jgi:PAS domain S-box-containing protein
MEVIEQTPAPGGGREYWWNFKFPFRDAAGNKYIGGAGVDITERKGMEEALREREERFRSLFNKGAVPMAVTATDSRLVAVNAAYCEMLGYSEEDLAGMSFYSITHPDDIAENKIGIDAVVKGERDSFRMEKRYFRKDGRVIWVDMSTASVRDPSGRVLYIVTHAPDITERKRAEQELIESEKRFSRAFYASPLPTVISTMDEGRLIDFNERWLETLGYAREEMLGRTVGELSIRDPEERKPFIKKLKKKGSLKEELIRIRTKSGQIRDVLWSAEIINISGEEVMLSQFHDLTERKRMEEDLREAKEKLEAKVQERTTQLTAINKSLLEEIHERKLSEKRLRSAQKNLRAMAAEIVLAEERSRQNFATDLHDTVVQTLGAAKLRTELLREYIPEEGSRYLNELRNMLSQSISEARLIMAEMSPPVLYELGFNPAIEWLAEQISSQHDLDIDVVADDHEPSMHEVQVLLFQAARELLMNIVKHANAGKVLVSIKGDKKNICITVKDDGEGFDGNVSFRADTSSGFGLFSIRERLKHMGGRLVIQSKPGHGTRVSVTAPRTSAKYPAGLQ